jgi:hypothetical protein
MLIQIMDPSDHGVVGELFNADVIINAILQGGQFDLFFSSTGSDSNDVLFNLAEPPSFFGPPMVWGSVDQQGDLALFLSPTSGEASFPFATLRGIGGATSGTGELSRSNKLPPDIDWAVSP